MRNLLFYLATVLIWGSTWIGIKLQLGRITSYNVCYTKLLREQSNHWWNGSRITSRSHRTQYGYHCLRPSGNLPIHPQRRGNPVSAQTWESTYHTSVITSYSIHYTKLYEHSFYALTSRYPGRVGVEGWTEQIQERCLPAAP